MGAGAVSGVASLHPVCGPLAYLCQRLLDEQVARAAQDVQQSIKVGLIGLVLFPLLAVWAFLVAGRITQPLLSLSNAVMAAE